MAEYRQSARAVFDLKYHMIWCTTYRNKILRAKVAERARDLIRQIGAARYVTIVRGSVSPDHIHLLVAAPPVLAPAKLAQVHQRPLVAASSGGVPGTAEAVLGTAHVGARVLLRDGGRGGRGDD
jgi:REP element-mobilizing transposase RayT